MIPSVGQPLSRVDGRLKVTGAAPYAAEFPVEHVAHAVMVLSTISRGSITSVDSRVAESASGVLAVLTPFNAPRLAIPPSQKQNPQDRVVQVLQDAKVLYQNQPVAVVVADTLERATHAAALVKVRYQAERPSADFDQQKLDPELPPPIFGEPVDKERGHFAQGLAAAEVKVEGTYTTPFETHNPMEPHATLAVWGDSTHLTIYDATQGIFNERKRLSALFGLEPENLRVICKFLGGGFGCKGSTWSHVVLAILAAKVVSRPVKLVLQRPQMFGPVGGRPRTEQRVVLGARRDGTLTALKHATINATSTFDLFTEPCALTARMIYECPNILTSHRLAKLSIGTPTFMRAPGESSGSFALETAMDELAVALTMDPLALRLKNHADQDPDSGHPWSSKSLRECYRVGAEAFGWSRRTPQPGSMRDGKTLIGWGMATATYPTKRSKAAALARLLPDGTALAESGTQDLGTGAYTVFTQVAADALGLPVERVRFDLGDTRMPETPVSGGSQTSASVGSAVKRAAEALRLKAIGLAVADPASPLFGADPQQVAVEAGRMLRSDRPTAGETYEQLLRRQKLEVLEAKADAEPGPEKKQFAMHAFGADFVEVRVDPELCEVRVSRAVGAFGVGRVLNAKTARSQLIGGMVWGIGMALMEQTVLDARTGRYITQDLADYHVPTHADVPNLEVHTVAEEDPHVNEVGAKGIGEIGITGMVAAIGNAVFHATGRRVRDLPLTLDKLLLIGGRMRELRAVVQAHALAAAEGEEMLLGTVVRVTGSVYRRPGARMLMTQDRWLAGAVSGGCLERHLLQRAAWHTAEDRFARLTYDSTSDESGADGFGLGCKGLIVVLLERLPVASPVHPVHFIAGCLERRERGVVATVIGVCDTARVALGQRLTVTSTRPRCSDLGDEALAVHVEEEAQGILAGGRSMTRPYALDDGGQAEVFLELIPAPVHLVVFGGGYDVVPLAQLASVLGWRTTVVVDRPRDSLRGELGGAELVMVSPGRAVKELALEEGALAVVMTHNYAQDRALLRDLFAAPLRYLGVLGSRRRMQQLLEDLGPAGHGPGRAHLHSPIGLDLGAEQPEEIALAIVAEVQGVLGGRRGLSLVGRPGPRSMRGQQRRRWWDPEPSLRAVAAPSSQTWRLLE